MILIFNTTHIFSFYKINLRITVPGIDSVGLTYVSTESMRMDPGVRSNIISTPFGASGKNSKVVLLSVFGSTLIFEFVSGLAADVDTLGDSPPRFVTKTF